MSRSNAGRASNFRRYSSQCTWDLERGPAIFRPARCVGEPCAQAEFVTNLRIPLSFTATACCTSANFASA